MMKEQNPINAGLSTHLFWDVNKDNLDMDKDMSLIIRRVLEYGLWNDWEIIHARYGIDLITEITAGFREIEPKAANFIAKLSGLPLDRFRCYTTRQSTNRHWNF